MRWTPEGHRDVEARWRAHEERVVRSPLRSVSRDAADPKRRPSHGHRYVSCPLCGSDGYRLFYARTTRRWTERVTLALVRSLGRQRASRLASRLVGRSIAFPDHVPVRGYPVARCPSCDFFFRNPTYAREMVLDVYRYGYMKYVGGAYADTRRRLYRWVLDRLDFEHRTAAFDRRRLLDLGCGHGLFLDLARDGGWEPFGFDFAPDSVEHARTQLGLGNVALGDLEEDSFPEGFFDVVTLWSVAAHLEDPVCVFRRIASVLRPGGFLFLYTVNAGSLRHRERRSSWDGFHDNHLVFFTADTLRRALRDTGFSDVDVVPDLRDVESARRSGRLGDAHEPYFRELFERDHRGHMLIVAATRGESSTTTEA